MRVRVGPSPELVALLDRLQVVAPATIRGLHRHARRLAKDLTHFDSVWVDALVQVRGLTPYQAAEIQAGRGDGLRIGPYLLLAPLPSPPGAQWFRALAVDRVAANPATSLPQAEVRLTVFPVAGDSQSLLAALQAAVRDSADGHTRRWIPGVDCGLSEQCAWVASPSVTGRTTATWLHQGGRMPPDVVLEVARQMIATLVMCEGGAQWHGAISAQTIVLDPLGEVQILDVGLQAAVETCGAVAHESATANAYDYIAPERIAAPRNITTASELYSCAAVWWHMLAGRAPRVGATAEARRRSACAAPLRDIRPIAPDTAPRLAEVIARCTAHDPARRPQHFVEVLELLGPPSDRGEATIARFVGRGVAPPERLANRIRTARKSPHAPTWLAAVAGVVLATLVGIWPLWTNTFVGADKVLPISSTSPADRATPNVSPAPSTAPLADASGSLAAPPHVELPVDPQPVSKIVRATAVQPLAAEAEPQSVSPEFLISATRPVAWEQIRARPGQIVRARAGERACVTLPPIGAMLSVDNVRFENIDFVLPRCTASTRAALTIAVGRAAFRQCSFVCGDSSPTRPMACRWLPPAQDSDAELEITECVLADFAGAVQVESAANAKISLTDVLVCGGGPTVRWASSTASQSLLALSLTHCTVRGAESIVESAVRAPLRVAAVACVFSLGKEAAVVRLTAPGPAADSIRAVTWEGEGSVVTREAAVALWEDESGTARLVRDRHLVIGGLVRSDLGFAGLPEEGPDASRLIRWQVPLRSPQPPGIREIALPQPRRLP